MRVLITGGAGFIGSHLSDHFLGRGDEVWILDDLSTGAFLPVLRDETIADLHTLFPRTFSIVDGIVGMEGNGPIQGKPKHSGVLILGGDLAAVDATAARLMKIDPWKINYLERAGHFLGNIEEEKILQIAESLEPLKQDFEVIQSFAHAKTLTG